MNAWDLYHNYIFTTYNKCIIIIIIVCTCTQNRRQNKHIAIEILLSVVKGLKHNSQKL